MARHMSYGSAAPGAVIGFRRDGRPIHLLAGGASDEWEPRSVEDLEERCDEIRAELQNLDAQFEGRRMDDVPRDQWNKLNDELAKRTAARTELMKRKTRLRELAMNPAATERAAGVAIDPATGRVRSSSDEGRPWRPGDLAPSLWPTDHQLRQLHAATRGGSALRLGVEERAAALSAATGADQLAVQLSMRGREPRRISRAASIPSEPVDGMTSVEFPVFGAGAAGVSTEGGAKTEYSAITPGTAKPAMINIWTDTSRENVLTATSFESKLRTVLASKVAAREDLLLLSTVMGVTGVQSLIGALSADLVLEGAAMVASSEVGAEPNLVAANPADVATLVGPSVGTGGSASPPFASFLPTIHGMVLYPTSHVPVGEAVIGAWGVASRFVVGLNPTYLVDNISQIKNNLITILLEEAVALAVDEPQGFLHITAA